MPVIRVFAPKGAGEHGSHVAAAVMGAMMAKLSEPDRLPSGDFKGVRGEKVRSGNPNRLTHRQHVFPVRSIGRFANSRKLVTVRDLVRDKDRHAKTGDLTFCADRAWDQRTERSMKDIEDTFQNLIDPIVAGTVCAVCPDQKPLIDRMYALWHFRARYRELEAQEVQLNGIVGADLTKEQEENLELNGYVFARKSGMMPARQLNGIHLLKRVGDFAENLATTVVR